MAKSGFVGNDRSRACRAVARVAIAILLLSTSASLASSRAADAAASPATSLVAQASPPPAEPGGSGAAPGTARRADQRRGPAALVEARISDLHKKLHITPVQEAQFNAFADVMRANAQSMRDLFQSRSQHRDRTAPGMLHWYAQLAAAHADAVNKLVPVFDALYQNLSPAQKKAADVAFQALRQAPPARKAG